MALTKRTGHSIRVVRTALEVTIVGVGWLLGGVVGVGTVLYALAIGPLVQLFMPWVEVRLVDDSVAAVPEGTAPEGRVSTTRA